MIKTIPDQLSASRISTVNEGPSARVGHSALLVGNAFIVFGGDNRSQKHDTLDNCLYFLNTSTLQWSKPSSDSQHSPCGRYGHSLNIVGSRLFLFGGESDGHFFQDLSAFDLGSLQQDCDWKRLSPEAVNGKSNLPAPRSNHTMVVFQDSLYLFGGSDSTTWYNDVWRYDVKFNKWTEIECIGYIPSPREGHSVALVSDVMYIFGGRTQTGRVLGDLAAFRISSRRWYTFQNMGPAPSPRAGHVMTTMGQQILVIGTEDPASTECEVAVLDTSKIKYPAEEKELSQGKANTPLFGAPVPALQGMSMPERINLAWLSAEFDSYANAQSKQGILDARDSKTLLVSFLAEFRERLLNKPLSREFSAVYRSLRKVEFQRDQAIKELIRTRAKLSMNVEAYRNLSHAIRDLKSDLGKLLRGQLAPCRCCPSYLPVLQNFDLSNRTRPSLITLEGVVQASSVLTKALQRTTMLTRENECRLYQRLELNRLTKDRVEWHFNHTLFLLKEKQALIFSGLRLLHAKLLSRNAGQCSVSPPIHSSLLLSTQAFRTSEIDSGLWHAQSRRSIDQARATALIRDQSKSVKHPASCSRTSVHSDTCTARYNISEFLITRHIKTRGGPHRAVTDLTSSSAIEESENKYRVAMAYVKHLEKILRKMNREVTKYKSELGGVDSQRALR
ncbi:galactose oxidase [Ascobolus immersus RN42]|uniref:Galactose oxidase n=1 Tax=Ascobolus immersus RN42 TaxID=1160509 RepID=A0A3N4I6Z5_ASCIM|nr:galactose oxidase [Ascobolus immersus RN42]